MRIETEKQENGDEDHSLSSTDGNALEKMPSNTRRFIFCRINPVLSIFIDNGFYSTSCLFNRDIQNRSSVIVFFSPFHFFQMFNPRTLGATRACRARTQRQRKKQACLKILNHFGLSRHIER